MQLDKLVLSSIARQLITAYIATPKHAVLLTGPTGVGLGTIASAIATELVAHPTDITYVTPEEKQSITIEQIRSLYMTTRDKRTTKQVIVIDNVNLLSYDAQNAYLKLLEEPNDHTFFVLTSHTPERLLPTIFSRTQHIDVRSVSLADSSALLTSLMVTDPTVIQQMLFLANGKPAELTRLATDIQYFEKQAAVVRSCRELLTGSLYERLALIAAYSTRDDALRFVTTLGLLVNFMLRRAPNDRTLLRAADSVELTAQRLGANGHVRTHLMNLASQMV